MTYSTWELENQLWSRGIKYVVGIDEAGRGPWAGPVVSGAVCFPLGFGEDLKLRDSKTLTEKARDELYEMVISKALAWGVGIVDAPSIDSLGIVAAVKVSMTMAIEQVESSMKQRAQFLIIDGSNVSGISGYDQKRINKADSLHCSVSAAAIIAKVSRDRMMIEYAQTYPEYGFDRNKAYGTKEHKQALLTYGPTEIHRYSYKPISEIVEKLGTRQRR